MNKTLALSGIFLATLMIGAAYASAWVPGGTPAWAAWSMAFGITLMLVATTALGAMRDGRIGPLIWPLLLVVLVYGGGFAVVLSLPPADPADPTLWLGLPPRAAVVLYGIGMLPLFGVPLAYALTFDRLTLSAADLERIRRVAGEMRAEREAAAELPEPAEVG